MADKVKLTKSSNPAYFPWSSMVSRCTKPGYTGWAKYGGAGIAVDGDWVGPDGFWSFLEHIGPRPTKAHQIDRIDGSAGYQPGNVRWATPTEQNRNRKDNVLLTFNGETLCASEWAERLGISRQSLHKRLIQWPINRALTESRRNYRVGPSGRAALSQQTGSGGAD